MVYSLFIFENDAGTFDGYFPDVDGCFFTGDTVENATRNAVAAFQQHMAVLIGEGIAAPSAPTPPEEYIGDPRLCENDGYLVGIELNLNKINTESTKINVTLPTNMLADLDEYMKLHGFTNRSGFIAALVRKEISRTDLS